MYATDQAGSKKKVDMKASTFEWLIEIRKEGSTTMQTENQALSITSDGEPLYRNSLLEEYVDGLHFILSIGLELEFEAFEIEDHIEISPYYRNNIIEQFRSVFYFASQATSKYQRLFNAYVGLGEFLGFEWEEVEQAYDAKHQINFD